MKLLSLLLVLVPFHVVAVRNTLSPVTRVVELLQGLAKKVEAENKKEEDLYETYVCWAKTVIDTKTATNAKAQSRVDSLEQYISDLDSGRVELTTERQDLEKEIAGLTEDIETAEALREKEHEDYLAAKEEMEQAVAALESGIEVLKEGMEGGGAKLLAVKSTVNEGFKARVAEGQALYRAVEVGKNFLSKGDALFLQRILTGDVPDVDWKKLNRKATFKMNYKARSGKILETLEKMLFTFNTTLTETNAKEEKAVETHDTLMTNKKGQKDEAESALGKMEVEGAARGLTKTQAQDEVDALKTQITDDEGFISQTETDLEAKKEEWKERKGIQMNEVKAINEAISVLHSDDARDLFKKSHESQGYLFLQERSTALRHGAQARKAAAALTTAARRSKDTRLSLLASKLASLSGAPSHFTAVIDAIDNMITVLEEEETEDLNNKEKCEQDRADDTREAIKLSREMDELTDTVDKLSAEIKELETEIKEKNEEIDKIKEELKEAKQNREDENAAWQLTDKDDADAAALIEQAKGVLENFYSSIALMQKKGAKKGSQPEVVAGEAPPPPPPTWEEPYTGKQEENTGIVSILTLIKDDIEKDRTKADEAEQKAETNYQTFKTDSESEVGTLESDISTLEGDISTKEGDITSAESDRDGKKDLLKTVMDKVKDSQAGCDFITVNFEARKTNRNIEIDGLKKAKAILSGADFE